MPAFTFEKISPPIALGTAPAPAESAAKKQRGVMVQIFSRFVESRAQRVEPGVIRSSSDSNTVE